MTIRILLVDDQEMIRRGFEMVLGGQPDLTIAGSAENGAEAYELAQKEDFDVVVMDVRMPSMNGVVATELICGLDAPPKVLILTTFDLDEYVYDALHAGASGFLLKDASTEELVSAIRHVHAGTPSWLPARRADCSNASQPRTKTRRSTRETTLRSRN
ncbi:DNA-binding response regulator, NarL/FixJ family, contains REC and HTH domains [Brevibacterium aurantiacum]|uniref:DNA-binding response regulator, NarL/FixJ family, contains REC and HTH domains n=1 Tax=Brevibacterium aurantiacum TaxID=273384 RepID=A0A2H1J8M8_BREAU|nr:DNA-binding response regulator, NarL/FixJ family, contains REC and HTH domains [Brevibacterium aurantiacum]